MSTIGDGGRPGVAGVLPRSGHVVWALLVVLAALTLAACAAEEAPPSLQKQTTDNDAGDDRPDGQAGSGQESEQLRSDLQEALEATGDENAQHLDESTLQVTELPADALSDWRVARVVGHHSDGDRPVLWHYALGPERELVRLHGDPEAFNEVADADAGSVDEASAAEQLARTYLEATRPLDEFGTVLESVDDIDFRSTLAPSSEEHRDEIIATYQDQIEPPTVTEEDGAFVVTVYWAQGVELQRRTLTVDEAGTITDDTEVLVDDAPVVPGGR